MRASHDKAGNQRKDFLCRRRGQEAESLISGGGVLFGALACVVEPAVAVEQREQFRGRRAIEGKRDGNRPSPAAG